MKTHAEVVRNVLEQREVSTHEWIGVLNVIAKDKHTTEKGDVIWSFTDGSGVDLNGIVYNNVTSLQGM